MRTKIIVLFLAVALAIAPAKAQKSEVVLECGVACIVLAVGVIVIIQLKKLCDKIPPANPPAPVAPTNSPATNSPTSIASGSTLLKPDAQKLPGAAVSLLLDGSGGAVNCAGQSGNDPSGQPWLVYWRGTLETTTNLTAWQPELSVQAWLSPGWCVVVTPTATNWTRGSFPAFTATADGPALAGDPQRFFRLATP